ncbi:unnamed protein product [marine sediment metagenome]|uniref:Uncharacterized protein n=1 Tax=marine sediment metagenome TaxID=412755 RepID=X1RP44_9ZZZZ
MKKSVFYKITLRLINVIHKIINKDVNLPYLQKKYRAVRGRVIGIHIIHGTMEIKKYFKIEEGKATMIDDAEADVMMHCSLDTMLNLIKGSIKREYEGRKWTEFYSPLTAWSEGRLTVDSPKNTESPWLSDLELLSKEIYSQVFSVIREQLGDKLP